MSLADLYATGHISLETLERRTEIELMRRAPVDQPLPKTWQPIPDCDHEWLDITSMGSLNIHCICTICGRQELK